MGNHPQGRCRYAYFLQYGLKARPRRPAAFSPPEIGTFFHYVLQHTAQDATAAGGFAVVTDEELGRFTDHWTQRYIHDELNDFQEKSARFIYLFRRLCRQVRQVVADMAHELRAGDFVPLDFELNFADPEQIAPITLSDGEVTLNMSGVADRVDGWLHDGKLYLRVVDYKTGKKSFDLAELRYGLGLQMLLYLFTLKEEGQMLFGGHEIVPAGVLYTPAREPMLRCARDTEPEKIEKALKKELRRSGMVLEDPAVLQAMEHSALESPCYLPIAVKRDGAVTGSLASAEQLGKLSKYVDHILHEITQEVFAGNIDADPYARTPQQSACTYCEFASACHFENGCGSDRMEYIKATKNDEFWQYIDEVNGEGAHENG